MKFTTAALRAMFIAIFAMMAFHIGSSAEAAAIKQSPVCKTNTDYCIEFYDDDPTVPVVASATFYVPTAGTALVSFNGSMQCGNQSNLDDVPHSVIDLSTQIVSGTAAPNYQGPGGSRFAMRLPPGAVDHSVPINLASSRVIPVTRGQHTFSFKIVRNRMDALTFCTVFNGDFKMVLVP